LAYRTISTDKNIKDSTVIVDSSCSNPKIFSGDYGYSPFILYEKRQQQNTEIYTAEFIEQIREQKPYWGITQISTSNESINPSFGTSYGICFQSREDGVWKIDYTDYYNEYSNDFTKTKNTACNYENPIRFNYLQVTKSSSSSLSGFFLAFDSDSLKNNREIFIIYEYKDQIWGEDTLINISKLPGDDYKPGVAFLYSTTDSAKIAIVWEHKENNKTDIWWGVSPFHLIIGDVENQPGMNYNFNLYQNYPNPFNPTTRISYTIPKAGYVQIKIYDLLGREVSKLVDDVKSAGDYTVDWNGSNYSSGIYFYSIRYNNQTLYKKMLMVK
jgi:hypothetical protein